jgi:hypothetical protein
MVTHLTCWQRRTRDGEGSVRYLRQRGILLGGRPHYGEDTGKLLWPEARSGTVRNLLRHPVYAGAYAYARFPADPGRKALGESKTGRWEADPGARA